MCIRDRETGLSAVLASLKEPPGLVICDSQVIERAAAAVPPEIPLTTFSIAFSRLKGDMDLFIKGARALDTIKDGDKILILEACTHHPQPDDIGRIKIPRWIKNYTGKEPEFEFNAGPYSKSNIQGCSLIISCGGCMINRREMEARIGDAGKAGVPVTNYGILISYIHGVLDRVVGPFIRAGK